MRCFHRGLGAGPQKNVRRISEDRRLVIVIISLLILRMVPNLGMKLVIFLIKLLKVTVSLTLARSERS